MSIPLGCTTVQPCVTSKKNGVQHGAAARRRRRSSNGESRSIISSRGWPRSGTSPPIKRPNDWRRSASPKIARSNGSSTTKQASKPDHLSSNSAFIYIYIYINTIRIEQSTIAMSCDSNQSDSRPAAVHRQASGAPGVKKRSCIVGSIVKVSQMGL